MTTVKWLDLNTTGAPTLSGTVGSLIAVLNACLVNGWGSATVDSLVVAAGVATVTKSGHPFRPGQISEISGAGSTGGTLNGQRRVLTTTSTTYTFDATGIPNQTATGTILHKVAPLGWTKPFADAGNVAVYRMNSVEGTGAYYRVDDSSAQNSRIVGYASMSDLSTGDGPFPDPSQLSGGAYVAKSSTLNSTSRYWLLVGDDQGFYLITEPVGTLVWRIGTYFGDIQSVKSVDPYRAVVAAPGQGYTNTALTAEKEISYVSAVAQDMWFCRGSSGIGGAVRGYKNFLGLHSLVSVQYSGESGNSVLFPNPADNGFYLSPMYLSEPNRYRGTFPGMYASCHDLLTGSPFSERNQVEGVVGAPGRTLMAMLSSQGYWFVDITGPWR